MIARLLGIRPGEGGLVFRLGGHSFLVLAATTIFYTAAEALFLSGFDAALLPLPFLAGAIFSLLLSVAYERCQRTWSANRLSITLAFFLASLLSLLILAVNSGLPGGAFVLLAAAPMSGVLLRVENLDFFSRSLDTRAQKRLFATVGIMGGLGAVTGGLLVGGLSSHFPVVQLPWISVGLVLVSCVLVRGKGRKKKFPPLPAAGWGEVAGHRFAILLCLLVLIMSVLSTLTRYQLGAGLKESGRTSEEIASYLGLLNAGINSGAVLFQLFLARWIIGRLGVGASLAVYPVVLLLAGVAGLLSGGLAVAAGTLFLERLLRQNLQRPVANVALMPLPDAIRSRAALVVRGALGPVSIAVASVGILATSSIVPWPGLSVVVAALAGVAIALAAWTRREYVHEVTSALRSRRLRTDGGSGVPPVLDAKVRLLLEEQVASSSPEKSVLALRLLAGNISPQALDTIRDRWSRWEPWRREEAVRALGQDPDRASLRFLQEVAPAESERVQAARLECDRVTVSPETLDGWIQKAGSELRSAAAVRLLREKGVDAIRSHLREWIDSGDPGLVEAAVVVIGETSEKDLWSGLPRLSREAPVAVARVMAHHPDPKFASLCVDFLVDDRTFRFAREALIGMGASACPALVESIRIPLATALVIQVLGRIPVPEARSALLELLSDPDDEIRSHAARALSGSSGIPPEPLRQAMEREWEHALQLRAEESRSEGILRSEAKVEFDRAVERLFLILALLYPKRPFRRILLSWLSPDPGQRSFALEALEANLDSAWREKLLPVLEGTSPVDGGESAPDPWRDRLRKAIAVPGSDRVIDRAILMKKSPIFERWRMRDLEILVLLMQEEDPAASRNRIVLSGGDPVHLAAGILGMEETSSPGENVTVIPMSALYHTIQRRPRCGPLWLSALALHLLSSVPEQGSYSLGDISLASRRSMDGAEGDRDLSLWERMFFLGSVPLFRGMGADRLKLVAEISRPLTVPAGSRIVREGTPGHHYYVVCTGTVEVAVEGKQVSVLGGGEGFGEMALLSGEPRRATVRAVSRCDLLSIDQIDFLDLVHVHPSLVRSFTPMIAERSLQIP